MVGGGQCYNDAWIFHVREYRWERMPDDLPLPPPRFNTAAAVGALRIENERLELFQGCLCSLVSPYSLYWG
jgi:hypothetical protein